MTQTQKPVRHPMPIYAVDVMIEAVRRALEKDIDDPVRFAFLVANEVARQGWVIAPADTVFVKEDDR